MWRRRYLTIVFALVVLASHANAQPVFTTDVRVLEVVKKAAADGLRMLRGLATKEKFQRFGFGSLAELESLREDEPFCEYFVAGDRMPDLIAGKLLSALMERGPTYVFPVSVEVAPNKRATRTSITVATDETGRWLPVAFGASSAIRAMVHLRAKFMNQAEGAQASFCTVRVPALEVTLLSFTQRGRTSFVPVTPISKRQNFDPRSGNGASGGPASAAVRAPPDLAIGDGKMSAALRELAKEAGNDGAPP